MSSKKLYDLQRLMDIAGDDHAFINKMILMFIDQVTTSVDQINNAIAAKDFKTVSETMHRIKASVLNMGIGSVTRDIADAERLALENPDSLLLTGLISNIEKVLLEAVEQLKNEV